VRLKLQHKYQKDAYFIFHIVFAFDKTEGLTSIGLYSESGNILTNRSSQLAPWRALAAHL